MAEPMKGDQWQGQFFRGLLVISFDNILQSMIRSGIIHHCTVFLRKNPLAPFPILAHAKAVFCLRYLQLFEPQSQ